ncbi:hypothetical protein JCM16303_005927 [Sporobolomyces ruberrimus]
MPSSSTGIERSTSPQPRSRSIPTSTDPTPPRFRQQQPHLYSTPEVGYHPTSKPGAYSNGHSNGYPHLQPAGGGGGGLNGHANPSTNSHSSYRPRSPLHPYHPHAHQHEQGTLSTLITQLYRSALSTFSSSNSSTSQQPFANLSSSSSDSPSASLLHKLRPSPTSPHLNGNSPSSMSPAARIRGTKFTIPSASTVGFVLLCCLWYLSSALSSNTGKSILTRFRYPVTLTFVQFAFVAGYSLLVLVVRNRFRSTGGGGGGGGGGTGLSKRRGSIGMNTLQGWGVRKPTKHMFHGTFMMSLFQIAGHVFSSMAIARVPVSTVHTIKALSPLFTVLSYVALFGVRYSTPTYLSLFPLTIGVMLACSFDLRANAIGFLCALGSTLIFVAQNIFSKKLLPKESSGEDSKGNAVTSGGSGGGGGGGHAKLDKMNLLFYSSGMAFFLMIPIWLYSDASSLFFSPPLETSSSSSSTTNEASTASLLFYFFLNGTVHFGQNLLAFSLLARTSPVTYSIASLVKRIAVICIAIVWFGQKVKPIQGFGMTMTFAGLYMYNQSKGDVAKGEKKRILVEKKRGFELPTSLEDVQTNSSNSGGDDTPMGPGSPSYPPPRISLEHQQPLYNPYHPPQPPPPPHASGASSSPSTNHGGQASRNRQTSLPVVEMGHNSYPLPPTTGGQSNSAPSTHYIPQQSQQYFQPHNSTTGGGGVPIQAGYR